MKSGSLHAQGCENEMLEKLWLGDCEIFPKAVTNQKPWDKVWFFFNVL